MSKENAIVATPVPDEKRLEFLPRLFGRYFMKGESYTFGWMRQLCEGYQGGLWKFYDLSNHGGYMALDQTEPMDLKWPDNGYSGRMSADAAGIVATLYALNHLANETEDEDIINHYYQLREYASGHPEMDEIFAAID